MLMVCRAGRGQRPETRGQNARTAFWPLAKGAGRHVRQERDETSLLLKHEHIKVGAAEPPRPTYHPKERRNLSAVSMVKTIC